jgi:hypothetical protein
VSREALLIRIAFHLMKLSGPIYRLMPYLVAPLRFDWVGSSRYVAGLGSFDDRRQLPNMNIFALFNTLANTRVFERCVVRYGFQFTCELACSFINFWARVPVPRRAVVCLLAT